MMRCKTPIAQNDKKKTILHAILINNLIAVMCRTQAYSLITEQWKAVYRSQIWSLMLTSCHNEAELLKIYQYV